MDYDSGYTERPCFFSVPIAVTLSVMVAYCFNAGHYIQCNYGQKARGNIVVTLTEINTHIRTLFIGFESIRL